MAFSGLNDLARRCAGGAHGALCARSAVDRRTIAAGAWRKPHVRQPHMRSMCDPQRAILACVFRGVSPFAQRSCDELRLRLRLRLERLRRAGAGEIKSAPSCSGAGAPRWAPMIREAESGFWFSAATGSRAGAGRERAPDQESGDLAQWEEGFTFCQLFRCGPHCPFTRRGCAVSHPIQPATHEVADPQRNFHSRAGSQ